MIRHSLLLVLLCSFLTVAGEIIPPPNVLPGIERGSWSLEAWGNSGAAERTPQPPRMLKLIFDGGEKDKTAFKHLTYFGVSRTGKLRLNVYAPQENPPQFAVALCTTVAYEWHESQSFTLKQGWNALELNVDQRQWKTKASNWEFTARVEPLEEIRGLDLIVYNAKTTGVLYVYGIHYDPDATGERVAALAKKLQSEDPLEREEAEKGLIGVGRASMEALIQLADDERTEVMLRAASALREVDKLKEQEPPDPKIREELEKQREEQRFDESRRRAQYAFDSLISQRVRLLQLMQDAHKELLIGRTEAGLLKHTDAEKKKAYTDLLEKMETTLKELEGVLPGAKPAEPMKK